MFIILHAGTAIRNILFDIHARRDECMRREQFFRKWKLDPAKRVVRTGGFKISHSIEELVTRIQEYLHNPKRDAEGGARIREEQSYRLNGRAGERIAEFSIRDIQEAHAE